MTTHICKDFLAESLTSTTVYLRYYGLCLTAYFLKGVLGFSTVGNTNFNIDSTSITKGNGVLNANINFATGYERAVQLPLTYTVSVSDIGRVLALKSNSYPMMNSGLFRVTGFDSATNSLFMAARSWLDTPPSESNISWVLFEHESTVTSTFLNGNNGLASPNYKSEGIATTSRIILQSPHSTGWQVRICAETPADVDESGNGHIGAACTITPGFGGNSSGDFPRGGQHLHHAQFWGIGSSISSRTVGTVPGIASISTAQPGRYYIWGDDVTGTCFIVVRQHGSLEAESVCCFGLPEDEDVPTPSLAIQRLFSYGSIFKTVGSSNYLHIKSGPYTEALTQQMGSAFGFSMQPITCIASSWAYSYGQSTNNGIMNNSTATDDAYMGATVLWSWDLIAGTYDNAKDGMQTVGSPAFMVLEPRRLGRIPFAKRGRENYNQFSTSTDVGRDWFHVTQGVYLPWSGSIVP